MSKEQTPNQEVIIKLAQLYEDLAKCRNADEGAIILSKINDLINAKVLEALEKYRVYAWKKGLTISDLETFIETEVKPKYK